MIINSILGICYWSDYTFDSTNYSNDNINSELINSIANYFEISGYDF